jgi:hypothetical protein
LLKWPFYLQIKLFISSLKEPRKKTYNPWKLIASEPGYERVWKLSTFCSICSKPTHRQNFLHWDKTGHKFSLVISFNFYTHSVLPSKFTGYKFALVISSLVISLIQSLTESLQHSLAISFNEFFWKIGSFTGLILFTFKFLSNDETAAIIRIDDILVTSNFSAMVRQRQRQLFARLEIHISSPKLPLIHNETLSEHLFQPELVLSQYFLAHHHLWALIMSLFEQIEQNLGNFHTLPYPDSLAISFFSWENLDSFICITRELITIEFWRQNWVCVKIETYNEIRCLKQ